VYVFFFFGIVIAAASLFRRTEPFRRRDPRRQFTKFDEPSESLSDVTIIIVVRNFTGAYVGGADYENV